MKKTILYVGLLLTVLLLLTSCGKIRTVPSLTADQPQGTERITLTTQYPVYAPDCGYVSVILSNNSGNRAEYGSAWLLEREEKGEWRTVPFVENFGFTEELISIENGAEWAQKCALEFFASAVTKGHYRIAKRINGAFYYAEFDLDPASPVTAEAPFGIAPPEKLPKDYNSSKAISDGVVFRNLDGTVSNAEHVTEFFEAVRIPQLSAFLRTGYSTSEGDLILEDLLWDGEKLCVTRDNSRDRFAGDGGVTTAYYSTFMTDETNVYPANSAWFPAVGVTISGFTAESDYTPDPRICEIVRNFPEDRRMLKVYSADGLRRAGAIQDEPLSYGLHISEPNGGYSGIVLSVNEERTKDYPDAKIVDFAWEGNTLMVMVQLDESWYYYEFVDSDTHEVVSYTGSQYPYEIHDGRIVIME